MSEEKRVNKYLEMSQMNNKRHANKYIEMAKNNKRSSATNRKEAAFTPKKMFVGASILTSFIILAVVSKNVSASGVSPDQVIETSMATVSDIGSEGVGQPSDNNSNQLDNNETTSFSMDENNFTGNYTSKGYKIYNVDGITYINGILVVNKTYPLPENYNPGELTAETKAAFAEMKAAAADAGIKIWEQSGYRSYNRQNKLYNSYVNKYGKESADQDSAKAGYSEHQTGLAIDVNETGSTFAESKAGIWLAANCADYGFIIRFPEGKEGSTGYRYESWHVRYVGKDLAKELTDSNQSLEEYLGINSEYT